MDSAVTSPITTAAQQRVRPLLMNFFNNTTTNNILTDCSKIWETAFGVALLLAMKYPLRHEVIPIKGSERGRNLIDIAALWSPSRLFAIKSDPKKRIIIEAKATKSVKIIDFLSILMVPFLLPKLNSSATRRVTAVLIPLEAKVAAKTWTENIRL